MVTLNCDILIFSGFFYLKMLSQYGMQGNTIKWFKNYLQKRQDMYHHHTHKSIYSTEFYALLIYNDSLPSPPPSVAQLSEEVNHNAENNTAIHHSCRKRLNG